MDITQAIGSLGFPIVACIALFWRMVKSDEQRAIDNDKMSDALNNNTLALVKLTEKLGDEKEEE